MSGLVIQNKIYDYRLVIAIAIYSLLFVAFYPQYQYILDDDGVGYATITRRWAEGDYFRAINGLWSQLHCWLAVPFYKAGLPLLAAFKILNGVISVGVLITAHRMLRVTGIPAFVQAFCLLAMIPFCLYITFFQLAADNLFCFLFLLYCMLCIRPNAFGNIRWAAITGTVAGFAYLSKAYALPLFLLHFPLWQLWLYRQSISAKKEKEFLTNLLTGLAFFALICLPWIIAMHHKYGFWTYSYAGLLNRNLNMMPYIPFTKFYMAAPPWPDSPTLWEDPYFAHHKAWERFSWWIALPRIPKLLLHNLTALIGSFNRLSYLAFTIAAAMFLYLLRKPVRWVQLCLLSVVLLPAGYMLLHIEDRFLWPLFFLMLMSGAYLLHLLLQTYVYPKWVQAFCWLFFLVSFVVTPLNELQNMMGKGKGSIQMGTLMQREKLTGNIASNRDYSTMRIIAFASGSRYFESTPIDPFWPRLPQVLQSMYIDHFYLFYANDHELKGLKSTALYNASKEQVFFPEHKLVVLKLR